MANKVKDLSGQRAGKLEVVKLSHNDDYGRAVWLCKCDCGNQVTRKSSVMSDAIKKGKASHCGCSPILKTHGLTKGNKKLHWVWAAMIQRCVNNKSKDYPDYGGRGISVCDAWRDDFSKFHEWSLSNGYADGMTIDRKNNDLGYCPENCKWVSVKNQMRNQRKTIFIEWNGQRKALTEWAELIGISEKTLRARLINYKWPVEKALTEKAVKGRNQHSKG